MKVAGKAFGVALVLTGISFFNGGVRYSDVPNIVAPVGLQLLRNFLIIFVVFYIGFWVLDKIEKP